MLKVPPGRTTNAVRVTFDLFCQALGLLWLLDLLAYLPFFTVAFGKIEARGYAGQNPGWTTRLALGWLASGLAVMFGNAWLRLAGSLFFYVLYRHFYIDTRWSSIRRGFGAPGFMNHWAAFYLLMLQFSAFLEPALSQQVLFVMRVDFAVIMICAGTYKYMVGYLHHDGMEYGCVNPYWGYFWRFFLRHTHPRGWYYRVMNHLASGVEIVAGVMMLFPATRVGGAVAISLSFLYVGLLIRLGRLAFLMALLPVIYFPVFQPPAVPFHLGGAALFYPLTWAFLGLLPAVKFLQYYNLFANKSLPQPLQKWLSSYANFVPIIMWRVFTPDVTNFYLRIYEENPERPLCDEETFSLSNWSWLKLRFLHVTESIASVSVFTTLKYFPSNRALFNEKLLKYSLSLQHSLGRPVERLRYEYIAITKMGDRFAFWHVGNFRVDLNTHQVSEEKLVPEFDFAAPSKFSPVRESAAPGNFTPLANRAG